MRNVHRAMSLAALAVLASGPAPAEGAPSMLTVYRLPGAFKVCATGTAANYVMGNWQLTLEGTRADGSLVGGTVSSPGATINTCVTVPKSGAPSGAFVATLAFVGVVPGEADARVVVWTPVSGDVVV